MPCFVMLVDGREANRMVGATSREQLRAMFLAGGARVAIAGSSPRRLGGATAATDVAPAQPMAQAGRRLLDGHRSVEWDGVKRARMSAAETPRLDRLRRRRH